MAPPQLASLENYSDVQFRDVVHRRSTLVAPSANVIQKTYHHMDGSTPRLSGAELLTTDAGGNVQYSLMLGSNTRPLDANVMTLANAASWTANSIFTANATHMTVRAPTLIADSIDCQSLTLANDVSFANVSASSLTVVGNIQIDTSTLTVDSQNNRVGIGTTNPSQALEIAGNINISSGNGLRLGGTQVLSAGTLGSSITQSSLTSVGTLGTLSVTGTATAGNISTIGRMGNNATITQGTHLAFNSEFDGVSEIVNKYGLGSGGFSFYTSPGNETETELSENTRIARMNVAGIDIGTRTFNGGSLSVTGNVSAGNLSSNVISATTMLGTNLEVTDHVSTASMNVTTGNITAYGTNHVIDSTASITVRRTLTDAFSNTGIFVGNLTHLGACSMLEVTLNMHMNANNSVTKAYTIPIRPVWYWTGWKRALPFTTSHSRTAPFAADISLDLLWDEANNTQVSLAIARSKTDSETTPTSHVDISMRLTFQKDSGWNPAQHFVPLTTPYSAAMGTIVSGVGVTPPVANLMPSTALIQTGDLTVGIGKYRPNASYVLDVGGQANFDSAVYCRGGLQVDGGFNYSGNLVVDGTQVTGMGLIFGPALSPEWRLYYNPTTQNLEIHQNNDGNPLWTNYSVTGILAAK